MRAAENNLLVRTREPSLIEEGTTRAGAQRSAYQTSDVTPAETLVETKWPPLCTTFVPLLVKSIALQQ